MQRRRETFAEEVASGVSLTQAAIAVGFSPHNAALQGSRLAKVPTVAQAIADKRSQSMREANITVRHVYERLGFALDDVSPRTRASLVRAAEILLRASSEIGPDAAPVNVDARSILLPGAALLSVAELESQLASLERVRDAARSWRRLRVGRAGVGGCAPHSSARGLWEPRELDPFA